MSKQVTLLRSGNRLVVSPSTPKIRDALTPSLRYTERKEYRGKEKFARKLAKLPVVEEIEWECYSLDHRGRLATSYGFREMITGLLEAQGYEVKTRWASKVERAVHRERLKTVYKPRWDRIDELLKSGFKFRYKQKPCLQVFADEENGRVDCHTGWGKGTMIMLAGLLFPTAKIDVVTKRVAVLHTRLYPELAGNLPSVGIVGGGKRIKNCRVMCYTADSLHHGRPDADFVFVDEGHEACADGFAEKMGIYDHARCFAFSASWDMRLDNKDLRGLAMFGPVRVRVDYQKGVDKGLVVPMEIRWGDVIMDENPCSGETDLVRRKRLGIWTNEHRNKVIAKDARKYRDDQQVLITVETLEHALHLKKLLPEFKLAYSGQGLSEDDIAWFKKQFPDEWVDMTQDKLNRITRRFSKGRYKKAIATTVWNVGVDFRNLEVLIRGDGGGSPINDVQIPGRNSRKRKDEDIAAGAKEKFVGIVHDYLDQFDTGFKGRSMRRSASYARNKWKQVFPDKRERSSLRRLMQMGSYV